jgi:protein-tyrosine phosphatase
MIVPNPTFVDIHCHLVPGIDDGAADLAESLAMARMAVDDGIDTIICTPHQGGNFAQNRGDQIRAAVAELQRDLDDAGIPLRVLPGADVRIESDMLAGLQCGDVVSLADRRRHVLLELPHELYMPLEPVLQALARAGMAGILSHPERNQGILARPAILKPLVEAGCLMQITAGSLVGAFGSGIQKFSESMLQEGLVHFVATDAHGTKSRRPLIDRAYRHAAGIVGSDYAEEICRSNPSLVAAGITVAPGLRKSTKRGLSRWFGRRAG